MSKFKTIINGKNCEDYLECPICQCVFTDPRHFFPCLHTFCCECLVRNIETCIENPYYEITCPLSRTASEKTVSFFIGRPRAKWLEAFPKNRNISDVLELLKREDEYCCIHPNRLVELICVDDSALCCSECLLRKHRRCGIVERIEDYTPTYLEKTREEQLYFENGTEADITSAKTLFDANNLMLNRLKGFEKQLQDVIKNFERIQYDIFLKISSLKQHYKKDIETLKKKVNESASLLTLLQCQSDIKSSRKDFGDLLADIRRIDGRVTEIVPDVNLLQEELENLKMSLIKDLDTKSNNSYTCTDDETRERSGGNSSDVSEIKPCRELNSARFRSFGVLGFPGMNKDYKEFFGGDEDDGRAKSACKTQNRNKRDKEKPRMLHRRTTTEYNRRPRPPEYTSIELLIL
ncbi:E3 ubiquitin-protein ligase TRIM13-like [Mercenaria mercenaria]|uniref:E3 ubiquitin-protein ligase TRIM13-like n=1 Tax=Mercenaria mercenaria TaxID=6596 RepID=UPI00234E63AA|nr:E3 ubiquitin-protein ligase TRIM13-like [Mercenaria mercenaria]